MRPDTQYYFYITTSPNKKILYCGMTNNLPQRIIEHYLNRGNNSSFAGRYFCYWLIYYESYQYVEDAIAREKEIKKWRREKKEEIINTINAERKFLNYEIFDEWPPKEAVHRGENDY